LFDALFCALPYAVGAADGRRSHAVGAGATLAVFAFAANGILPQVDGLGWIDSLSAFHWLNGGTPLRDGLQLGDLAIMTALVAGLVGFGTTAFERRDIAV
jgi:ABC-2 type transport system permease protein